MPAEPKTPTLGLREIWMRVLDGPAFAGTGSNTRRLACTKVSVPRPESPEVSENFIEGELVSVNALNQRIPAFSFEIPVYAMKDSTKPTMDEILGGTGLGSTWTPINNAMEVQVDLIADAPLRCFYFEFYFDGRSKGTTGKYTKRVVQGFVERTGAIERADGITVIQYAGKVYGTITDYDLTET